MRDSIIIFACGLLILVIGIPLCADSTEKIIVALMSILCGFIGILKYYGA